MKHTLKAITWIVALVSVGAANAEITIIERPYEVTQLRITMRSADTGEVLVKECDTCEDIVLKITPETKFYKSDREIPLAEAFRYRGQEGVVMRDAESNTVTRIRIY